jgi:RNA polymerase sigma factor for flagellar operon FliA
MQTTQTSTDALWRRYRSTGCIDARRDLLGRYLGLVHHAAREVAPKVRDAVSLDELVSAGSLGLLQSMEGFDPERGLAFSTFAMRRIRGAILDDLRARDPLSRSDRAHTRRHDAAMQELEQKLRRQPTQGEVARHLGVDDDTMHRWRERAATVDSVSLESERLGGQLSDRIGFDGGDEIHGTMERAERRDTIRFALDKLPHRERLVLLRSYLEEKPLREIAGELGVTESRVCQLRTQALARMRRVPELVYANE